MASFLQNQSFISIDQISTQDQINEIFERADEMKEVILNKKIHEPLRGKCVSILFYQPSTRTFTSFVAASKRLGAYVIDIHGMQAYSSVSKGETLEDTIQTVHQTMGADAVILRHPDNKSGEIARNVSSVPILNAGSGKAEHPTQAVLDLYTIKDHIGKTDNIHVAMVGDLLYGRTVKSLAKLLAVCGNNKITLISPPELAMPKELIEQLSDRVEIVETDDLESNLKNVDVLYMTRVQKEWFEHAGKLDQYEQLKDKFILDNAMANKMPKKSIIMHPLPRVGEILHEVDDNPRAKYFQQMRSGLYTRMALLDLILEG